MLVKSMSVLSTVDDVTVRHSPISYKLPDDHVEQIDDLRMSHIRQLCKSQSVFGKSKRYEVKYSTIIKTQSSAERNIITGQIRAARIHEQSITWGHQSEHVQEKQPFTLANINVFCSCRYFTKETIHSGWCCSHILGQLRRVLFIPKIV